MKKLAGKVCIVTGSTSGIGLETAKELAKMGAMTILVARDESRGKAALTKVKEYAKSNHVELFMCDFSVQASILAFTKRFMKKYHRLDILINNAGLMSRKRIETEAGIELTFAVNHLGYFITTNLLLDLLKSTPNSRIVVASDLHFRGRIDPNNLLHEQDYDGFMAYSDSKLANILFTYKLAEILQGTDTTINAVHPGVIKTKFGVEDRNSSQTFTMGRISPQDGAKALIFLSTSPQLAQISGKYFNKLRIEQSSPISYDKNLANALWRRSLEYSSVL